MQIDRFEFRGDTGQIAGGRVATAASTRSIEIGFAGGSVAGEELFERVVVADVSTVEGGEGLGMQESHDIRHLIGRERERGHSFIGAAFANHGTEEFAVVVVAQDGRPEQVRTARAGGVVAMTKSAGRLEFQGSALRRGGVRWSGGSQDVGDQKGQQKKAHSCISIVGQAHRRVCLYNGTQMEHFRWDDVPLEAMSDVISRKIISGEKAMVAQVFIKKDAVVPAHQHESEQITYILEGALKFELDGKEVVVRKGEVLHIPSNVVHRAVALEDTLDLDIFSPIRVDWLTKDDQYLRRGELEKT